VTYVLWDKNRLTWDDDRKVVSFVTSDDSAIGNYASFVRTQCRGDVNDYLPQSLQIAMQFFEALGTFGILYQQDPTSPFTAAREKKVVVDSVSLPRETLKRITGDCDDLSVLFATMLECVAVPTAFVTVPGHIYCALDTGVSAADYRRVHPDRDMLSVANDRIWIPVEITMIGRASFMDAWQKGVEQWRAAESTPEARGFYPTAECRTIYSPVVLKQTDLGLQYGDPAKVLAEFRRDANRLGALMVAPALEEARKQDTTKSWNSYGVTAARLGLYAQASDAFASAIRRDPRNLAARVNLGSLEFLASRYREALASFQSAEQLVDGQSGASERTRSALYINIWKTAYELEDYETARKYVDKASALDPEAGKADQYLAAAPADSGRAAEVPAGDRVLFAEEE
jgi:tetratricopeptide (TPR) repeat protein